MGRSKIRIQHRRVANSRHGPGEQLDELWIVHDFRPRGIAQKFAQRGEHFALLRRATRVRETPAFGEISIAAMRVPKPSVSRSPSASVSHTATSASRGIALRYFLSAAGDSSAAESLAAGAAVGRGGKIAQQRSETQFGIERAQRFDVRLAPREIVEHQLHRRGRCRSPQAASTSVTASRLFSSASR